ncbi:MAG TPA: hypothetical protein VN026_08395 [Bacteroidia bacterium]|jgi:hypothetical protein|nr:hypothetical protein [Bacteroidia bacterium]
MITTPHREPLILATGMKGVGKSFLEEREDAFILAEKFMHNLKLGDSFTLENGRSYFVKKIGKFNIKFKNGIKPFKKLTLKSYNKKIEMFLVDDGKLRRRVENLDTLTEPVFKKAITNLKLKREYLKLKPKEMENITFYFLGGIHGNPKSRQKNSDSKQYGFMRDIEGQLIVDLLNKNNPLHEMSEIYKIVTK